ncbi:hypothetical protein N9I58_00565 [Candidatus Thioglobus sp.]|nr:hypothetical protein [Candidatus Thioglobus sp.]
MDSDTENKLIKRIDSLEKELKEEIDRLDSTISKNAIYEIEGNGVLRGEMRKADLEQGKDILKIRHKLNNNDSNWYILTCIVVIASLVYWFNL